MKTNLTRNDELNILTDFFSMMELPMNEIEKRIEMSMRFLLVYKQAFAVGELEYSLDKSFDEDFFVEYLSREYADILKDYGIVPEEKLNIKYITETTANELGRARTFSEERAIELSENETNQYANIIYHNENVEKGYTRKRWQTMQDELVRFSHVMVDGEERPINEPFNVGGSEMMFPMDTSLGADASEIIGCRCSLKYF